MPTYSPAVIQELRAASDIVGVISQHVSLKRVGKNLSGLCPFHKEKTPSFYVNPHKQFYKCYGCGEGGDVISFVRKVGGLGFPEAVRQLAQQFHVALPEREEQVVRLLEYAHHNGVILVARGGGSGVLGAAASLLNCVVLDTSRLKSRFQLGSGAQGPFVCAGAGMLGGELEGRLNAAGFSLMNFPASLAVSSVGGWIATRAAGQYSTRSTQATTTPWPRLQATRKRERKQRR